MYGAEIWGIQDKGRTIAQNKIQSLKKIQNRALWTILGGYKRYQVAALEKEANVILLNLHIKKQAMQYADKTKDHKITQDTAKAIQRI